MVQQVNSTVQAGDCVGNKCSDTEEELVRWRGRLRERQIVREGKWFICKKLMFADWQSLVNRQFSAGRWRMLNRGKLIRCSILAICCANVKVYLKLHVRLLCVVNHACTSYVMYSEWFVNTAAGLDPQQTTVWDVIIHIAIHSNHKSTSQYPRLFHQECYSFITSWNTEHFSRNANLVPWLF